MSRNNESGARKPKHRAEYDPLTDGYCNPRCDDLALCDCHACAVPVCKCDPLTDGYANIDCDTHGIPAVRRDVQAD